MVVYVAVQCFQCAVMQAKQEKKSNNKWACAICNEKQSFRKIFARSFCAKDIRKFVQEFNILLPLASPPKDHEEEGEAEESKVLYQSTLQQTKEGQSKWSEYITEDLEACPLPLERQLKSNSEFDNVHVVTALPDDLSSEGNLNKRRKKILSSRYSSPSPLNPTNPDFQDSVSVNDMDSKFPKALPETSMRAFRPKEARSLYGLSGHRRKQTPDSSGSRVEILDRKTRTSSKWDAYLEADDESSLSRLKESDSIEEDGFQTLTTELADEAIDEDVHLEVS